MANWNNPTLSSLYVDHQNELKSRDLDAATLFLATATNTPVGAFRYNRTDNHFEEWDGAVWVKKILSVAGGGTGAGTGSGAITGLGLGTMSAQNSNAVSITGGVISGLTSLDSMGPITGSNFTGSGSGLTNVPNAATTGTNLPVPNTLMLRDANSDVWGHYFIGNLIGEAETVMNGVYTTGSYPDPAWITSLGASKIIAPIPDAKLTSNVSLYNTTGNTWSGTHRADNQPRHKAYYLGPGESVASGGGLNVNTTAFGGGIIDVSGLSTINLTSLSGIYLITVQLTLLPTTATIIKLLLRQTGGSGIFYARDERVTKVGVAPLLRLTALVPAGAYIINIEHDAPGVTTYGAEQSNTYIEVVKIW